MGRFDGILICSDWDGTLFCGGTVPEDSVNAIKYFQSEGGLFTVCSGRGPDYLRDYANLVTPNTYAICYNGALICDLGSGEIIKSQTVGQEAFRAAELLIDQVEGICGVNVSCVGEAEFRRFTPEQFKEEINEIKRLDAYKVTLSGISGEVGEKMVKALFSQNLREHTGVRSFVSYIEILHNDNLKGSAARFLKEKTGARVLVGIGDYENDLDLIEKADIGYAVENAIDQLKARADRVTVRADEAAVAHIIRDLEFDADSK